MRPLTFGEVLFDQFSDGTSVLGGAPFNVAWHLRGFGLDPLLATPGDRGAIAWTADGDVHRVEPEAAVDVVDTVGAGDAFSSVVLFGLINGWPLASTLARAQGFASAICQMRGATVQQRDFYERQTTRWRGP